MERRLIVLVFLLVFCLLGPLPVRAQESSPFDINLHVYASVNVVLSYAYTQNTSW